MMSEKSIVITYILWLIGGLFSLHHLYLRRDKQAFIYWTTLGGYFGLGVLRDFYRIPTYVKDTNNERSFMRDLAKSVIKHKKPPFSILRFSMEVLVGNSWGYLLSSAFPGAQDEYGYYFIPLKYCSPLASAFGVWMVGTIGRQTGGMKWPLIGSFSILPFVFLHEELIFYSSFLGAVAFEWKGKQWRRTPYVQKSLCRRLATLGFGWLVFSSLWVSLLYFNGEITTNEGETARVKDILKNFVNSPMYEEFKKNTGKLYNDVFEVGWSQAWINLMELLDPFGEYHAFKVLGLKRGANQTEISSAYKKLTKEWHPDRQRSAEKKHEAHEKFIEIAAAYETLSTLKRRRSRRSTRSEENTEVPL